MELLATMTMKMMMNPQVRTKKRKIPQCKKFQRIVKIKLSIYLQCKIKYIIENEISIIKLNHAQYAKRSIRIQKEGQFQYFVKYKLISNS